MSLRHYAPRLCMTLALLSGGLLSCGDTPVLTTDIPISSLPSDFGPCLTEINSEIERLTGEQDAVACFYAEGASRVLETPLGSACSDESCDLGSWQKGAPEDLTPNNGTISFVDPSNLVGTIPARLVLLPKGRCMAPNSTFVSPDFECQGASSSSTNSCFASFPITAQFTDSGVVIPSTTLIRFEFSRVLEEQVRRGPIDFDDLCSTSDERAARGPTPISRRVRLTLTGSGTGTVTVAGLGETDCAKPSAAPTECTVEVLGGTSIALTVNPGLETTAVWDSQCRTPSANRCELPIENTSDGDIDISLDLRLNIYPLAVNLLTLGDSAPGEVTAPINDAAGRPVRCGPAPALCRFDFEFDQRLTLEAKDSSGGTFAFTQWSAPCPEETNPFCELTISQSTTVSATFESDVVTLQVNVAGLGSVEEADRLPGEPTIRCGPAIPNDQQNCSRLARDGETVRLTAIPRAQTGEVFRAFETPMGQPTICQNSGAECVFTVGASRIDLRAVFTEPLTVGLFLGEGSIVSTPTGIDCRTGRQGTCSRSFDFGTQVSLTASPEATSAFIEWGITATTTDTNPILNVPIDGSRSVDAIFGHTLRLSVVDDGFVQVNNTQTCDSQLSPCGYTFREGSEVSLTATARIGSEFVNWSGAGSCTATQTNCTISMSDDQDLTGAFAYRLTGSILDNTNGSLNGGGLVNCRGTTGTCLSLVNSGQSLSISGTPDSGYGLLSWGKACSGTNIDSNCSLNITGPLSPRADYQVEASFGCLITVNITGRGSILSPTLNNNMGVFSCNENLSLVAQSSFIPVWSGVGINCPDNTLTCVVSPTPGATYGVTFSHRLTVTSAPIGTGNRVITQGVNAIQCGSDCTGLIPDGSNVTLIAEAGPGFLFERWPTGSPCEGVSAPTCTFVMSQSYTFGPPEFSELVLTVNAIGAPGQVNVIIGGNTQACPTESICTYPVSSGLVVSLQGINTNLGGSFAGFEDGPCSGTGTCTLTVGATSISVRAVFNQLLRIGTTSLDPMLTTNSRVIVSVNGVQQQPILQGGQSATYSMLPGSTVTLTAEPELETVDSPGNDFDGWFDVETQTIINTNAVYNFIQQRNTALQEIRATFNTAWRIVALVQDDYPGTITTPDIPGGLTNCSAETDEGEGSTACRLRLPRSTTRVRLTAVPSSLGVRSDGTGWFVSEWTECSPAGNDCFVDFNPDPNRLTQTPSVFFQYPISYSGQILPSLIADGCTGCHGPPNTQPPLMETDASAPNKFDTVQAIPYDRFACGGCGSALCCQYRGAGLTEPSVGCTSPPPGGTASGRIHLVTPENSLLLQMPLAGSTCTNHSFAKPWTVDNPNYIQFLDWIRAGGPVN